MPSGASRVVQLHQRGPAGEELRIDLALARREAVAGHGVIGGLTVAALQGVEEIVAALAPQGVLALDVRRRGGQGAQQGEALGLAVLRAQDADAFQRHGGVQRLGRTEIGHDRVRAVGGAQGHDRVGHGLPVGRNQLNYGAGGRAVRAEQQHVQPRRVVGLGQAGTPSGQDTGLGGVVE